MKKNDIIVYIISLLVATFFVLTNSDSTSPLFHEGRLDSDIFQYVGYAITKGKIPYTDVFDHKGLFLYWIEALGYLINPSWGVFFLQIINLSLVILIWNKILIRQPNLYVRLGTLFLCLLALYAYYSGGNLTEEWSLLPVSYPFLLYYKNQWSNRMDFSNGQLLTIGICMGILFLIRPNNAAPVVGMLIYCLFHSLWRKEYAYIGRSVGLILVGFLIPTLLAVIYMLVIAGKKGVFDMIYGTVIFNIEYSAGRGNTLIGNIKGHANYIYKVMLPLFPLFILLPRNRNNVLLVLLSTIITLLSLGGTCFYHYLMIFIPLLALSINCITSPKWLYLFIGFMILIYGKTFYRQFDIHHFQCSNIDSEYIAFEQVLSKIPEKDRDNIWNMGGGFLIRYFKKAGILQQNRMLLLFQLNISPSLYKTEAHKIQKSKPKYIIGADFAQSWMNDAMMYTPNTSDVYTISDLEFIQTNYSVISSAYWPDGTEIICYRRK